MKKFSINAMKRKGFTLAELLIALAILGVIATFTIPKVLNSQQNSQYNSMAKEVAAMLSESYAAYNLDNSRSDSTTWADLTPYFNYVKLDTTTQVLKAGGGTDDCSASRICMVLHNGGIIWVHKTRSFGGTGVLNSNYCRFNPSPHDGTTEAVTYVLYYNGRITSHALTLPGSINSSGAFASGLDPSWFSWD